MSSTCLESWVRSKKKQLWDVMTLLFFFVFYQSTMLKNVLSKWNPLMTRDRWASNRRCLTLLWHWPLLAAAWWSSAESRSTLTTVLYCKAFQGIWLRTTQQWGTTDPTGLLTLCGFLSSPPPFDCHPTAMDVHPSWHWWCREASGGPQ